MKIAWVLAAAVVLSLALPARPARADEKCPQAVVNAVEKAFPGSTVKGCKSDTENGKPMYNVKLKTKDGMNTRMNLDQAGVVLLTQQYLADNTLPGPIMKEFQGKHKDYKVMRTEKWTYPDGKVTYRVTYLGDGGNKKSAVYTSDGVLVEETETKLDDDDND